MRTSLYLLCACAVAVVACPALADGREARHAPSAPMLALATANDLSRQHPENAAFEGARSVYGYRSGALYEIYANPNYVSTILLEPGETLNSIAAGDTSRWLVTQADSESADQARTVVLVKPQAIGLRTNIVLITDRRTYLVEAISLAGGVYSAEVAWSYPTAAQTPSTPATTFNFDYRISTPHGRAPVWFPKRVFDDGRRTWIEFDDTVAASDMPPLFVVTEEGAELVNYRVQGQTYVVDRVFDVAELRLGTRAPTVVRIERHPAARGPTTVRRGLHP